MRVTQFISVKFHVMPLNFMYVNVIQKSCDEIWCVIFEKSNLLSEWSAYTNTSWSMQCDIQVFNCANCMRKMTCDVYLSTHPVGYNGSHSISCMSMSFKSLVTKFDLWFSKNLIVSSECSSHTDTSWAMQCDMHLINCANCMRKMTCQVNLSTHPVGYNGSHLISCMSMSFKCLVTKFDVWFPKNLMYYRNEARTQTHLEPCSVICM